MSKDNKVRIMIIVFVLSFFIIPSTISMLKSSARATTELSLARWNVSLNQTGANDSLTIVREGLNDSYTLSLTSTAEVDIKYDIIIKNLPTGVEVSVDNGSFVQQVNNVVTLTNVGTVLYTDSNKTKTHTLHFRAVSGATIVRDQTVDIDVLVEQVL